MRPQLLSEHLHVRPRRISRVKPNHRPPRSSRISAGLNGASECGEAAAPGGAAEAPAAPLDAAADGGSGTRAVEAAEPANAASTRRMGPPIGAGCTPAAAMSASSAASKKLAPGAKAAQLAWTVTALRASSLTARGSIKPSTPLNTSMSPPPPRSPPLADGGDGETPASVSSGRPQNAQINGSGGGAAAAAATASPS